VGVVGGLLRSGSPPTGLLALSVCSLLFRRDYLHLLGASFLGVRIIMRTPLWKCGVQAWLRAHWE
jgi:hypothetical protein